jgi:hypothetical protein
MQFDVLTIGAILSTSGITLANIDENTTGGDDYAGNLLIYAGDLITAIHGNEDLPPLPELIINGAQTKITGYARVSLIMSASLLPFLMVGAPSKFRTAIRYLQQAMQQLLAGKTVPPMPADVKATLTAPVAKK